MLAHRGGRFVNIGWFCLARRKRPRHFVSNKAAMMTNSLALDVGLGPIAAWRLFFAPTTIFAFVRNIRRNSWNELLLRCTFRCLASQVMRRKSFGIHPVDSIGLTTVVLDNFVNDLGHGSLLTPTFCRSPRRPLSLNSSEPHR